MRIDDYIWLEHIVEKLWVKHRVDPEEVIAEAKIFILQWDRPKQDDI